MSDNDKDRFLTEVRRTLNFRGWEAIRFPVEVVTPIFKNFDDLFERAISYGLIAHVNDRLHEIRLELPWDE